MRIALGGIHIESSIFTPYRSGEKDFRIKRGDNLVCSYPWIASPGEWPELADEEGTEWIGLVHARALPGGMVQKCFFDEWQNEFFTKLDKTHREKPIDVLLLDIHGAMTVEGMTDCEGTIASKARQILGNETTITATMDLHGNVSDLLFDSCDLLTAYRTAPHVDADETRFRAINNGILHHRARKSGQEWYKAKTDIPILLSGEKTSTVVDPGKSLYALIPEYVSGTSVADVAIWMGFPWADEDRNHAVVVSVGDCREQVVNSTKMLASNFLKFGNNFEFVGPADSVAGAIKQAFNTESEKPFFISDTGDNPGAGGTGDSTNLLASLYSESKKHGESVLFASIFDPKVATECAQRGVGGEYSGFLGAKIDEFSKSLFVSGVVEKHAIDPIGGETIVLECGNMHIIVSAERNQYTEFEQFDLLGLDIRDFDVVAVKIGYLEPDLAKVAKGWVMALSTGAVNQDLTTLSYKNLRHPMIPFEAVNLSEAPTVVTKSTRRK